MNLFLKRVTRRQDAIFGVLEYNGYPQMLTLELPMKGNRKDVSSIPEGTYPMKWRKSARFKRYLWEVCDVRKRSNILIHVGNRTRNSIGCILVGTSYGKVLGEYGIRDSAKMVNKLHADLKGKKDIHLVVT